MLFVLTKGKQPTARRERTLKQRTIVLNVMCMCAMASVLKDVILLSNTNINMYCIIQFPVFHVTSWLRSRVAMVTHPINKPR